MPHLPTADVDALIRVLVDTGLVEPSWLDSVFSALPPAERAGLTASDRPRLRLEQSLHQLNDGGALPDGRNPLALILRRLALEPIDAIVAHARRLLQQLEAGPAAAAERVTLHEALGHMRLIGAELFVARDQLRRRLRTLSDADGPPAMIVNGGAKVGKSHTRKLLAHAARATGELQLAWVEIQREQAASFTADWLMEELVRSLVPGAAAPPDRREPEARWLGDLVSWAFEQLVRAGTALPIWLLIDGVGMPAVTDEVRRVVERLVVRAATQTGPLRLRLVLIDCDANAIRRTGCVADEEEVGHLTATDFETCMLQLDPTRFARTSSKAQALLTAAKKLTTPMVSAVMREALRA